MKCSLTSAPMHLVAIVTMFLFGGCFSPDFPNTCFLAGTKISTPEGPVAIEKLRTGQSVIAYDQESGQLVDAVIELLTNRHAESYLQVGLPDGRLLNVTDDHPLAVRMEDGTISWIQAGHLTVGDLLVTLDATSKAVRTSTVSSVQRVPTAVPVYNLKVRHYENSFAEGVLSHFYFENMHQMQTQR